MRVLVIGGGGREHALAWKIADSPLVDQVYCAPGNAGIAEVAECVPIAPGDILRLRRFARENAIDLTVVGSEEPLVKGIVDSFATAGLRVFGPTREAARLEGSKVFCKQLMQRHGVPTAEFRTFNGPERAKSYLEMIGAPVVVKADGLAAGKGVMVAKTLEEAEAALAECFVVRRFGDAANVVLIEEYLEGEELSLLSIVSGNQVLPLAPAQDYKRIFDGDEGPNTGGMGSYSPVPSVDDALYERLVDEIVRPTVAEIARRGIDYRGVLYAGLMLTDRGPEVLEFNCRFGDPETQALLPRLQSDLLELLWTAARGETLPAAAEWSKGPAVGVVMASGGYPGSTSKGDPIIGLEKAWAVNGVEVFHAGTRRGPDRRLVTAGGRVLTVTGLGDTFAQARARAYEGVAAISFTGEQHRTDIALRAEEWEARR